jgi:hypothetical protein
VRGHARSGRYPRELAAYLEIRFRLKDRLPWAPVTDR